MKKVLALILSAILILSLVGCGDDSNNNKNTAVSKKSSSDSDTDHIVSAIEVTTPDEDNFSENEKTEFQKRIIRCFTGDDYFDSAWSSLVDEGEDVWYMFKEDYSLKMPSTTLVEHTTLDSHFVVKFSLRGTSDDPKLLISESGLVKEDLKDGNDIKNFISVVNKIDTGYNFSFDEITSNLKLKSQNGYDKEYEYQYNEEVLFSCKEDYYDEETLGKRYLYCEISLD